MRYQVSGAGYNWARVNLNFDDQDVRDFSEKEFEPKVPADAARPCVNFIRPKYRFG